jgi:hypothetical protein
VKRIVSFLFYFCLFFVAGCATAPTISTSKYTNVQYTPTNVNKIEVYSTKLPKKEYEELAEIRFSKGRDVMILKEEAAKMGADAIIITGYNKDILYSSDSSNDNMLAPINKNTSHFHSHSHEIYSVQSGIKCVAIKFK